MASPITWKNVNQPNFAASNALLTSASRQMAEAFDSGSSRLIAQGEYNEKQNTDKLIGQIGAYKDYDNLAAAKAGLFAGMEGQNIDERAVADYFGSQQTQLGARETFNTGRKDTADAKAGSEFAFNLMNSGVTNEREVRSQTFDFLQSRGASPAAAEMVNQGVASQFGATTQEAADAVLAAEQRSNAFDIRLQGIKEAGDLEVARQKALTKGSSGSGSSGLTVQASNWKPLTSDQDAQDRHDNNRRLYLSSGVGSKVFDQIIKKYYDPTEQTIKFDKAEEELDKIVAINQQGPAIAAADPTQRKVIKQEIMKQNDFSDKEATAIIDYILKSYTAKK